MDEFIGIVKLFAGNFAPQNWAFCNGQLLSIAQNQALFAIIGTTYGGNGTTTFALPNLNGRAAIGTGQGAGLGNYSIGQMGGTESVTLMAPQLPSHTHALMGNTASGSVVSPAGGMLAAAVGADGDGNPITVSTYTTATPGTPTALSPSSIAPAGGNQPHENRPPYLALSYIICLNGLYPPRS